MSQKAGISSVQRNQLFGKRYIQKQRSWEVFFHFTDEPHSSELLLRTVIAVNQLTIDEAVSSWCYKQKVPVTDLSAEATTQPFPENLLPCLTKHSTGDVSARGDLAQDRDRKICNLLDEAKNCKVCEDAGFVRTVLIGHHFSSSRGLIQFVNVSLCREYTFPRDDDESYPAGFIEHHTRIGAALAVKVSEVHDVYGVEIKMYSIQNLLEPLSRCAEIYVTELSFGSLDSIYFDSDTFSTGRPCASIDKKRPASPNMTTSVTLKDNATHTFLLINEIGNTFLMWTLLASCFPISTTMIRLLRHDPRVNRDRNGAIPRDELVKEFDRESEELQLRRLEKVFAEWIKQNSIRILRRSMWSNQMHAVNSRTFQRSQN